MTGCSAVGCTNRKSKGFLMKRFPSDPERRKQWAVKVKRENWYPNDNCYLCEAHFAPEMFENKRIDGQKKLRWDAVPTIFAHVVPKKERKCPAQRLTVAQVSSALSGTPAGQSSSTTHSLEVIPPCEADYTIENIVSPNDQHLSSSAKVKMYNKTYNRLLGRYKLLKRRLNECRKVNKTIKTGGGYLNCLKKVFNANQIAALQKSSKSSFVHWNNDTIKKGLKLKFSCGNAGYEELLKQGQPLPSQRTLRRRVQNINFSAGVLDDVFDFLKLKVENFTDSREKDCALVLDEMSIISGKMYDSTTKGYIGTVTMGNTASDELATHALVFMLAGTTSRWKQTVAYHYTGASVNGHLIADMVDQIIVKATKIGLNVLSVTSDMGSSNLSFWKIKNIVAGTFTRTTNSFPHPSQPEQKVYIMADPVHLFKNIRSALLNNKIIELPDDIVKKNNLTNKYVRSSHLDELVKHQSDLNFQLVPKLHEEDLTPSHFDTMKVGIATNVISHSTVSGFKFLAEELKCPDYLTTAWFLEQVEQWFKYMTSRHPIFALSKSNIEAYEKALSFLTDFIDLFQRICIGTQNSFKPCQRGAIVSTQSILDIQKLLLETKNYSFVLTGRFTQDCVENLFSVVRAKLQAPNAYQFKCNLKLVMLSQYMRDISTSSYDKDEREEFSDFLELINNKDPQSKENFVVNEDEPIKMLKLNNTELNCLYCICGYLISSIKKINKTCDNCLDSIGGYEPYGLDFERLTVLKRFKDQTLFFCNELTFKFALQLEEVFNNYISEIERQRGDAKSWFVDRMEDISADHILSCHNLKETFVKRYVVFRLKINSTRRRCKATKRPVFNSKSLNNYVQKLR